jgi:putative transposase
VEVVRINQRWEMDHTTLDLVLVDEEDGRPIGRPTLCFAIDCFSRCPMGFYLGFEPPSSQTVTACLRHAITPKYYLRSRYPFLRNEWGAHGLPETIVLDRGPEFQNRSLDEACAELGIDIDDCPPREPHFKGMVERLFGTVNTALLSDIPGKTFSTIFEKEEYDPAKNAILPLGSFLKILHLFLVDYYLQRYHRGLKDIPAQRWREGVKESPPAMPQSSDDLKRLLPSLYRTIQPQGIEILNIFYNHDERLPALRAKYNQGRKKEPVLVRYDKWDMAKIWVFDRFTNELLEIPAVDGNGYTRHLSHYKHRIVLSHIAERKKKVDIDALAQVSLTIEEIVRKDYLRNRRLGTRKKLARFLGKGTRPGYVDLDREGDPFADIVRNLPESTPESGYENVSDLSSRMSMPPEEGAAHRSEEAELMEIALTDRRQTRRTFDDDELLDLRGWGARYDTPGETTE